VTSIEGRCLPDSTVMARFRHALVLPVLGITVAAALMAAGCSGSHHGDTAAFCAQLKIDAPTLTGRPTDAIAKRTTMQAFHRLAKLAPAAIFDDWARLTVLVDKLAAFDPVHDDPFGDIYAAALDPNVKAAADHVRIWSASTCSLDLTVTPATGAPPTTG
jgi:hypothetical protein